MYIKSSYSKDAQGIPPKSVIDHFTRKYDYDVDDYGYMFHIPPTLLNKEIEYAESKGFQMYDDPDNDDWYYLMKVDSSNNVYASSIRMPYDITELVDKLGYSGAVEIQNNQIFGDYTTLEQLSTELEDYDVFVDVIG